MMDSFSYETEDPQFFDALEQISPENDFAHWHCIKNLEHDLWINPPQSVRERRLSFMRRLGLGPDELEGHGSAVTCCNDRKDGNVKGDLKRIMENSGAVLRNSCLEDKCSANSSSMSTWSIEDVELSQEVEFCECGNENESSNFECKGEVNFCQCSCVEQQFFLEEGEGLDGNCPQTMDKLKFKWFSKLRSMTCMFNRNVKNGVELNTSGQARGTRIKKRLKVSHSRKRLKELSGLFTGQDIQAHDGYISVMKFSPDGHYLASAGVDKIVKVWQVVEDERSDTVDIPDADPSCVYFSVNHLSELGPLTVDKDRFNKFKILRKTPDSACVVLPPKVFRILEKPLRVFQGHSGEILDLSWSKNNYLLSSSIDRTVRLWSVGTDQCLKVFSHTDYVTCIQFNPVNDDYFISGSIDGKVRVWKISGCHVVKWTETRDIITAVSYHPNGKGGIIGFITGSCRFFTMQDGHIQLEPQMCLTTKKKPHCTRITGFQFLPRDPSKVLVTCSDSQVRIVNGTDVIAKYKGFRNAGHYTSASFTTDEKHIISASDDSKIYVWNYFDLEKSSLPQPKSIRSFECFPSDATVAITWSGFNSGSTHTIPKSHKFYENDTINSFPFSSTSYICSSSHDFYLDSSSKGSSATWPEEKLPISSPQEIGRSHYKLFKNSYESLCDSHMWGLVIVTGGCDGRIKSLHNYGLPVTL